uniref:Uncharacterized protein n=1 Tax=Glossina austeni TaxID=7395 RepID=A0A1A9V796_GLOAU
MGCAQLPGHRENDERELQILKKSTTIGILLLDGTDDDTMLFKNPKESNPFNGKISLNSLFMPQGEICSNITIKNILQKTKKTKPKQQLKRDEYIKEAPVQSALRGTYSISCR